MESVGGDIKTTCCPPHTPGSGMRSRLAQMQDCATAFVFLPVFGPPSSVCDLLHFTSELDLFKLRLGRPMRPLTPSTICLKNRKCGRSPKACGGKESIARHRAGELALVSQPPTLEDLGCYRQQGQEAILSPLDIVLMVLDTRSGSSTVWSCSSRIGQIVWNRRLNDQRYQP